jgi:hypothetical protein
MLHSTVNLYVSGNMGFLGAEIIIIIIIIIII